LFAQTPSWLLPAKNRKVCGDLSLKSRKFIPGLAEDIFSWIKGFLMIFADYSTKFDHFFIMENT
jgi:hypothetical protein